MNLLHFQFVFLVVAIGLIHPLFCQERTWRDATGTFQVQAECLAVVDEKVVLKKQNGNVIRVPLAKLSAADREYLDLLSLRSSLESPPIAKPTSNEGDASGSNSNPPVQPETPANSSGKSVANTGSSFHLTARNIKKLTPIELPDVRVTNDQIAALPRSLRSIAEVLHAGSEPTAIRNALTELADDWPGDNPTILDLVRKSTFCDEKFCRKKSLMLLCQHDLTNSFPFILARMDDQSFDVRWAAMEYIERSADPRALKPLVERFIGPDRAKISLALMTFGTQAEPYLQEYLKHERANVRLETSLMLGKMGTEASIPKLEYVAENDSNPVVALQAKSAIKKINDRLAESKK